MRTLMTPEKLQARMGVANASKATPLGELLQEMQKLMNHARAETRRQNYCSVFNTNFSAEVWGRVSRVSEALEHQGLSHEARELRNSFGRD